MIVFAGIPLPRFPAIPQRGGNLVLVLIGYFLLCAAVSDGLAYVLPSVNAGSMTFELLSWGFFGIIAMAVTAGYAWPIVLGYFCFNIVGDLWYGICGALSSSGIELGFFAQIVWLILAIGIPCFALVWSYFRDEQ